MPSILVKTDSTECGDLWTAHRSGLPFDDWDLRCELAKIYGVTPLFFIHEPSGIVLPCGELDGVIQFYGGERFSECNQLLGDGADARILLEHVLVADQTVRLLAWDKDPIGYLGSSHQKLEVPFNQYWVVPAATELEKHIAALKPAVAKEFRYLLRKFEYRRFELGNWSSVAVYLDKFISHTSESFAGRNRQFALDNERHRAAAIAFCQSAFQHDALQLTEIVYQNEVVGLCVIVDDVGADEAVYLMNLYISSPSDISNGVTLAAITYATNNKRQVNALRGAFTLKKKYGLTPVPSYAVVKDPAWRVQPQVDLDEDELQLLYGRAFGSAAQGL